MNGSLEEDQVSVGDSQAGTGMDRPRTCRQHACIYE